MEIGLEQARVEVDGVGEENVSRLWQQYRKGRLAIGNCSDGNKALSLGGHVVNGQWCNNNVQWYNMSTPLGLFNLWTHNPAA